MGHVSNMLHVDGFYYERLSLLCRKLNNPFNMSQNKTRFPGMENASGNPYNRDAYFSNSDNGRSQNRKSNEKPTNDQSNKEQTED